MKNFEGLLEQIKSCSKKKLAVAVAQDDAVLEAVKAAKDKDIADAILVGDADILLFPDIHAGNITYKTLVHTAKVKNGCILTGTKAPVILTSRSDTFETKVNSIALAAIVAENLKKNK